MGAKMATEIHLKNISKTYNPGLFKKKIQAVRDLSFDVHCGEVFGLIGPNGAGKSTTIRMILGLIHPDAGSIQVRNQSLAGQGLRREIGYLPENPYLYDHLTMLEVLDFCGRTSGVSRPEISKRSQELIAKLNLLGSQNRPLRTFSKGMLQRAGICFALLHNPSIVILDEPMSGLDPIGRKMVFDLVMELKAQGKTIFFCSHILNDVERLCDRIGLLNKGKLIGEFNQEELGLSLGKKIFLHTQPLSGHIKDKMTALSVETRPEGEGMLLAVGENGFVEVSSLLDREQIKVLGTRDSWMTLEDLFMQKVAEANQ